MGIISWFFVLGFFLLSKIFPFLTAPISAPVLIYILTKKGTRMPKYLIPVCFSHCLLLCLLACAELSSDLGENLSFDYYIVTDMHRSSLICFVLNSPEYGGRIVFSVVSQ